MPGAERPRGCDGRSCVMSVDATDDRHRSGGIPDDPRDEVPLGAWVDAEDGVRFRVWAPAAARVRVEFSRRDARRAELSPEGRGYFSGPAPDGRVGDRYWYRVGAHRLPDPASRLQPLGIRGPSEVVDPTTFPWTDSRWRPRELARSTIYELHVGTFSDAGTFDGAIPHLPDLADVGIDAVELLPVEEERADRGWGYGHVFSFAVRRSYGGPAALLRFVDAAHAVGLAVLLDVVWTHWSGEAAFLAEFGPYFHPRATTPWGPTPNFEGPGSDEVRRHFFECARRWLRDFHVDGFRLDAVHEVRDRGRPAFWAELSEVVRAEAVHRSRPAMLVAESDLNDARILQPTSDGGWGIDAQWADDFHSALHAALTGERQGYYADYGALAQLARAFETPFLFQGEFSEHRQRRHGVPLRTLDATQFVVFDQNHDQIGNRGDGARLTTLLPGDLPEVALAMTFFAPYVPMLFMGEEYGETRPFYFFTGLSRTAAAGLTRGRARDLVENGYPTPPPNPALPSTFAASKLDRSRATTSDGRARRALVAALIALRRGTPALAAGGTVEARAWEEERLLVVRRSHHGASAALWANVGETARTVPRLDWDGPWVERLRSGEGRSGSGRLARRIRWTPRDERSVELPGRSFVIFGTADDRPRERPDIGGRS